MERRLLILGTVGLLGNGTRGIFEAAKYQHPLTQSYAQFVSQRPTAGWFHIPDARLDLEHSILTANPSTDAYYVPVVSTTPAPATDASSEGAVGSDNASTTNTTSDSDPPVQMVAYITDNKTVRAIDAIRNSEDKQATMWGMEHSSQLPPVSAATVPDGVTGMMMAESGLITTTPKRSSASSVRTTAARLSVSTRTRTQPRYLPFYS